VLAGIGAVSVGNVANARTPQVYPRPPNPKRSLKFTPDPQTRNTQSGAKTEDATGGAEHRAGIARRTGPFGSRGSYRVLCSRGTPPTEPSERGGLEHQAGRAGGSVFRSRTNLEQMSRSRPDSGLGLTYFSTKVFNAVVPPPLKH